MKYFIAKGKDDFYARMGKELSVTNTTDDIAISGTADKKDAATKMLYEMAEKSARYDDALVYVIQVAASGRAIRDLYTWVPQSYDYHFRGTLKRKSKPVTNLAQTHERQYGTVEITTDTETGQEMCKFILASR